jgi:hypothetical protein
MTIDMTNAPCPRCGYCPHCGRSNLSPYWPQPPIWVQPTWIGWPVPWTNTTISAHAS